MSSRTKEDQLRAALPPGMLPKTERRALGKQAALKRAQARRRKKLFNYLAIVGIVLVVAVGAAAALGAFGAGPSLEVKPVVTGGTGDVTKLNVTTIVKGEGAAVRSGQTITVNYVGVDYKTGTEFDSSWKSGKPATFEIGTRKVIPGWDQGLVGVTVGSRVQLDIPSDLAYGDNPTNGEPPGDLRFVVDILDAK